MNSADPITCNKIAHDICSHIFAMTNALELIRLTAGDNPQVVKYLDMIDRQTNALIELASKLSAMN